MKTNFFNTKIIFIPLIFVLLFSPILSKKATAQWIVEDPIVGLNTAGMLVSTNVTAAVTTTATTWETIRKNGLDFLVYQASQVLMNQITNNIVNWIRGGFNGSPSFAIDPQKFFNDLADVVAGDFANQIRGLALCDFDANFRITLMNSLFLGQDNDEKFSQKIVCPFDAIDYTSCDSQGNCRRISPAEQAQAFAQNFVNGGWNAYEATLRDSGNKFGVALVTKQELNRRTIKHQQLQEQKLTQSGGFLDMLNTEDCDYPSDLDINTKSGAERKSYERMYCSTATPGSLISDQLSKVSGLDLDRLGFADNLNKIASAFIQQVTKMAIEGVYTPRADGGNGLTAARGTIDSSTGCAAASEAVTPTPEQEANITALVYASAGVQDLQDSFDTAQRNFLAASSTAQAIRDNIRITTIAYDEGIRDAATKRLAMQNAVTAYNQCVANSVISLEDVCVAQNNTVRTTTNTYNIAAALVGPSGRLYLAKEAADDGLVEAERAERATLGTYNSARTALNNAVDAAYSNATLTVMGVDMTRSGISCVEQNISAVAQDIEAQTTDQATLDELYRQAQEAEPQAI